MLFYFSDDVENLKLSEFTPEILAKAVSKCIKLIDPSFEGPDHLPAGPKRMIHAMTLGEACATLGCQVGYQTFLYTNISDVRKILMFLIEHLPKETEKVAIPQKFDDYSMLENKIIESLSRQLRKPWVPEFCNISRWRRKITEIDIYIDNFGRYLNHPRPVDDHMDSSLSVFDQTSRNTLLASLIHTNDLDCQQIQRQSDDAVLDRIANTSELIIKALPRSGSASSSGIKTPADENQSVEMGTETVVPAVAQTPIDKINAELETLRMEIETGVMRRNQFEKQLDDLKAVTEKETVVLAELKSEKKIQERINILLEDPEESVAKIDSIMAKTIERTKTIEVQWKEHQQMLLENLEQAKSKHSKEYEYVTQITAKIDGTLKKIQDCRADYVTKQQHHAHLVEELTKVDKKISRQSYTSKILEIIGNIKKQKTGIDKILTDTKELQKEINNITGKLERQFTVTDDLIYRTAKRNDNSRKAYKFLVTLHSDCEDIIQSVHEIGMIMREIRDIDDQVEIIKSRNISSNLQQISTDLNEMEVYGKNLEGKLKAKLESRQNE